MYVPPSDRSPTTGDGGAGASNGVLELLASVDVNDPDRIASLLAQALAGVGVSSSTLYLADYAENSLVPVAPGRPDVMSLPVHAEGAAQSPAGRAFLEQEVVEDRRSEEPRLWVPVSERGRATGVIELHVETLHPDVMRAVEGLGRLMAHLVASASRYSDTLHLARRRQDFSLPAEMQWSLLPPTAFATEGFCIGALLEPAYDVGGDAYDYSADGAILQFALLDAMGHGLHASTISALAMGALRWARRGGLSLIDQALEIDRVVNDEIHGDGFVSGVLGALDRDSGELRWITLAHEAPWIIAADGARPLEMTPCLPMGMRVGRRGPEPVEQRTVLPESSMVALTSDGITQARDSTGELLGDAPLLALLQHVDDLEGNTAYRAARSLIRAVLDHCPDGLTDDATAVVIARVPRDDYDS